MKETVFISGLYSGPSPSAGLGVARSLRAAFPSAHLVGVDYYQPTSHGAEREIATRLDKLRAIIRKKR